MFLVLFVSVGVLGTHHMALKGDHVHSEGLLQAHFVAQEGRILILSNGYLVYHELLRPCSPDLVKNYSESQWQAMKQRRIRF